MTKTQQLSQYKIDILAGITSKHAEFELIKETYLVHQVEELFEFIEEEMAFKR
jgi:hypothetical protein